MRPQNLLHGFCLLCLVQVGLVQVCLGQAADYYHLIVQGNVIMPDGSPPPKPVGIQRICSDIQGSASGPITDKKGHYLWQQDLAPADTRACYMEANLPGFVSTHVDITSLKLGDYRQGQVLNMPDIVLGPRDSGAANQTSLVSDDQVPGKAKAPYKAAAKALEANQPDEAIKQLQLAVKAVPKFADGWVVLGQVYEQQHMLMEARDALQHAIEADPKLISPLLRLARIDNKLGDWSAAAKNEDAMLKTDARFYPEIYLQQAITRTELKDYAGAEQSAKTALSLDIKGVHVKRAEYVLGRIALAKGDLDGAKQHMAAYIQLDPASPDIDRIQTQMENLGKPGGDALNIPLERP